VHLAQRKVAGATDRRGLLEDLQPPRDADRGLQPADPPAWMHERLIGETRDIMVVGHMPHLPGLLRLFTGDDSQASAVTFPLHGMVALEADGNRWKEVWRIDS
jgi:phosphohistidine phosphatase SixA